MEDTAGTAGGGDAGAPAPRGPRSDEPVKPRTYHREQPKIGRNEPCPCGSGKKYKKCCGREAA
jgi:hypothetical protein